MSPRLSLMPVGRRVFLSPASFVHLWTIDSRIAKLNLLKQLLVYDQLKQTCKTTNMKEIIQAAEKSNLLRENGSYSIQASLEEMARVAGNNSYTMLTYFRLLQIYLSQFLEKWRVRALIFGYIYMLIRSILIIK